MSSPSQCTFTAFHRYFISALYGKPAEAHVPKRVVAVQLFINMDGNETRVRRGLLCRRADDASGTSQYQIHKLSLTPDNGGDVIAIRQAGIIKKMNFHTYPYSFSRRNWSSPRLQMCTPLACMGRTVMQWSTLSPKSPQPPSPHLVPQQSHKLEVFENADDDVGTAVDIRGFNETAYMFIDFWVRINQIEK